MKEKGKGDVLRDALKMAMPVAVPIAVERILALIPPGSSVDDFLAKNNGIIQKIISGLSFVFLRATDHSEFADTFVAELSSEVNKELHERYSADGSGKKTAVTIAKKIFSINFMQSSLSADELKNFIAKLNLLDEDQRRKFLAFGLEEKKAAESFLKKLICMDDASFLNWAELMFPKKAPHLESEWEKKLKGSLHELKSDGDSYFSKPSGLEKFMKSQGII